jgi:hypothetical protein
MKSQRLLSLAFGTCFFLAIAPSFSSAQPGGQGGGGGGGGTSSGGATPANTTVISTTSATIKTPTSGAGSATSTPSSSNPLVQTYGDPFSMGKPANYATTFGPPKADTVTFGKGIYSTTAGAVASSASTVTNPGNGFTENGIYRNPPYATVLSSDLPIVKHSASALHADVRSVLDRSSFIRNPATVQVSASEGIVLLTGQVTSDKERRLVEGMVRTTPGVRNVQNNLTIAPTN